MTNNIMPRGGLAAFGAVPAVLFGAAWHLVPRWALLWVFNDIFFYHFYMATGSRGIVLFLTFVKFKYLQSLQ
jgi:hypothetical protein